ncbi:hypothetical protein MHPYR_50170 [uncultured Mycobacterium sp.]|uniref:Transposase n=1 Tax=uncultured Mycobacterium sp. TaxID=171292 RepID=A0A1Y5PH77_9MYCO|nr:hypothetical protein MHPYR_50170 [uncultured Mycobacterium sp.]
MAGESVAGHLLKSDSVFAFLGAHRGEGSDGTDGHWQIAQKVAPDRVISTVDPEARHAHKAVHRRQDGFKAHIAIEPGTGLDLLAGERSPVRSGRA